MNKAHQLREEIETILNEAGASLVTGPYWDEETTYVEVWDDQTMGYIREPLRPIH